MLFMLAPPLAAQQLIELASRSAAGVQAEAGAHRARVSADGRYVAFATASAAFDAGDDNGLIDVYLKDRVLGSVRRISRGPGGVAAAGGHSGWDGFAPDQYGIAISDDGGRVAFLSSATNLAADDGNAFRDAFLWDRASDSITLLSKSAGGTVGNGHTVGLAISGDGNVVAFSSFADNLVAADTNATVDLFARVLDAGTIERVNLTDADAQMPAAPSADRGALAPSLSRDGRYVGFLCEPNLNSSDCAGQCAEMWVRDRQLGTTIQASRLAGQPSNTSSGVLNPVISPDGRYAAWASFGDMALPDTDSIGDVFLRDLVLGVTEHVSQTTDGAVGHIACGFPGISAGGRFVTFHCNGSFGPDDTHLGNDAYVRDRSLGQTLRYSVSATQGQPVGASELPVITPDGTWLAFESGASNLVAGDANGAVRDVFLVRNPFLFDPPSRIGSGGGSPSTQAALSEDARYLFFETAEALQAGDLNGSTDVYRRELATGIVQRVSVGDGENEIAAGAADFAVSADGQRVVFIALDDGSVAPTTAPQRKRLAKAAPVPVAFLRDIITGSTQRLGPLGTPASQPAISADGSRVALVSPANGLVPGDANGMDDVFVADVAAPGVLLRVSAPAAGDANGASGEPALSRDGEVVVFQTQADNLATSGSPDTNGLADVIRADLGLGQRRRLSATPVQEGNGASTSPSVSGDGRYIVFTSAADNLGPGDGNGATDVFVVDALGGGPLLVSAAGAIAANGASGAATISADGTTIAFSSAANDLVAGDGNSQADLFVVDRASRVRRRLARGDGGTQPNGASDQPRLSRDGQRIAFQSQATNYSLLDANGSGSDVFLNGPLEPFLVFRSRFE